jgi:hypothetical protein
MIPTPKFFSKTVQWKVLHTTNKKGKIEKNAERS